MPEHVEWLTTLSSMIQPLLQWVPMSPICSAVGGAHGVAAWRRTNPRIRHELLRESERTLHYTERLRTAVSRLEAELPEVTVEPIVADYTEGMRQNSTARSGRRLVLYIGSSIGNFSPADAVEVLRGVRAQLSSGDCLLLGTDMVKDAQMLHAAYDDAAGVTARFNMNVLTRINRELEGNFDLRLFRHQARWNARESRLEMHLESLMAQRVALRGLDMTVRFERGETIHTENSYKFSDERVLDLLTRAGFRLRQQWSDENKWFTVYLAGAC